MTSPTGKACKNSTWHWPEEVGDALDRARRVRLQVLIVQPEPRPRHSVGGLVGRRAIELGAPSARAHAQTWMYNTHP